MTAAAQPRLHALTAMAAGAGDPEIELEHERARATAEEGAALARAAGFDAKAYSLRTDGSIGEAIVDCADRHPTRLVVIGTRGLSGVRAALTGSVTQHVTRNVHVPVLAVTSAADAQLRNRHRRVSTFANQPRAK